MNGQVLIVYGCEVGDGSLHDPVATTERIVDLLKAEGCSVTATTSLDAYTDQALLAATDLIIPNYTGAVFTPEQMEGLLSAIRSGVGLGAWHGGGARQNTTPLKAPYEAMIGGSWILHPPHGSFTVRIARGTDPIVAGIQDFAMDSEQFFFHVDPGNEVLATFAFDQTYPKTPWIEGVVMPCVWKRRYGEGRVFYSSLGHANADFDVPQVLDITRRGLLWAMKTKS